MIYISCDNILFTNLIFNWCLKCKICDCQVALNSSDCLSVCTVHLHTSSDLNNNRKDDQRY